VTRNGERLEEAIGIDTDMFDKYGWEWGIDKAGAYVLAGAILSDFLTNPQLLSLYSGDFMREVLFELHWPGPWELHGDTVVDWIVGRATRDHHQRRAHWDGRCLGCGDN
jgi:hypothetical protein